MFAGEFVRPGRNSYPLTTPRGTSLATLRHSPAPPAAATTCPSPREPQWIITQTCPAVSPNRSAAGSKIHCLDFQEVVAGAEAADLVQPAVDGTMADLRRVGVADCAMVLAPLQVTPGAVAMQDRVEGAAKQHLPHLRPAGKPPHASASGATRDGRGEPVHYPAKDGGELIPAEAGGKQAHAA